MENTMQSFEIPEMKDIKYISFKHTTSDDKVGVLHLKNINNMKVRFKTLYNTNVFDLVEFQGKTSTIREALIEVKYNKAQLFCRVE